MPSSALILEGLRRTAHDAVVIAGAWHLVLFGLLVALFLGWRPTRRTGSMLLGLPLASVAVTALVFSSPFNAVMFAIVAALLVVLGARLPRERVQGISTSVRLAAACLLAFGWVYPHFFWESGLLPFLYAAPIGLVPCPTLAVVLGLALAAGGFGTRAWSAVLASFGLFYGLFGVFRLGVVIDLGLVIGALALLATSTFRRQVGTVLRRRAVPLL